MKKTYVRNAAICVLLVLMISCNLVSDRSAYVDNTLTKQVDSASQHLLQFSNFTKVDGVELQTGSLKYELKFKGRISAMKNCYWDGTISYSIVEQTKIRLGEVTVGTDSLRSSYLKKDYGYDIKGTAVFEKRDRGWTLIAIYFN